MADWTRYAAGDIARCPCPIPTDRRADSPTDRRKEPRATCGRGLCLVEAGHTAYVRPAQADAAGTRHRCQRCGNEYQLRTLATALPKPAA